MVLDACRKQQASRNYDQGVIYWGSFTFDILSLPWLYRRESENNNISKFLKRVVKKKRELAIQFFGYMMSF